MHSWKLITVQRVFRGQFRSRKFSSRDEKDETSRFLSDFVNSVLIGWFSIGRSTVAIRMASSSPLKFKSNEHFPRSKKTFILFFFQSNRRTFRCCEISLQADGTLDAAVNLQYLITVRFAFFSHRILSPICFFVAKQKVSSLFQTRHQ